MLEGNVEESLNMLNQAAEYLKKARQSSKNIAFNNNERYLKEHLKDSCNFLADSLHS